jgi:hypothetical protein
MKSRKPVTLGVRTLGQKIEIRPYLAIEIKNLIPVSRDPSLHGLTPSQLKALILTYTL